LPQATMMNGLRPKLVPFKSAQLQNSRVGLPLVLPVHLTQSLCSTGIQQYHGRPPL
jgi:hypothetical protein